MNEQMWKVVKNLKLMPLMLALALAVALTGAALAAPPLQEGGQTQPAPQQGQIQPAANACTQTYVVQAGDSLSTIAGKFLNNIQAFPQIVEATNAAGADKNFARIDDPNVIVVGQTLCIPAPAGQLANVQQQQQPGQLQQGSPQANTQQKMFDVPEGMSKVVFENLSTKDLIVDISMGPTPQSMWIGPGVQQEFVLQPGTYLVMGHQPGVEFAVTPKEVQLQAGDLAGVTCEESGQCQTFTAQEVMALQGQSTTGQGNVPQTQPGMMQQNQQEQPAQPATTQPGTTQPGQDNGGTGGGEYGGG